MKEWGLRFLITTGLLFSSGCAAPSSSVFPRPVPDRVAFWGSSTSEMMRELVSRPSFKQKIAQKFPQVKEIFSDGRGGWMLHNLTPTPLSFYLQHFFDLRINTAGRNDLLAGESPQQLADEISQNRPGDFWAFPYPVNRPGMAESDRALRQEITKHPGLSERVIDVDSCYSDFSHLAPDGLHPKDEQAFADWTTTTIYLYTYGVCPSVK